MGKRMSIKATRACVDAVLDGSINKTKFNKEPVRALALCGRFGLVLFGSFLVSFFGRGVCRPQYNRRGLVRRDWVKLHPSRPSGLVGNLHTC